MIGPQDHLRLVLNASRRSLLHDKPISIDWDAREYRRKKSCDAPRNADCKGDLERQAHRSNIEQSLVLQDNGHLDKRQRDIVKYNRPEEVLADVSL